MIHETLLSEKVQEFKDTVRTIMARRGVVYPYKPMYREPTLRELEREIMDVLDATNTYAALTEDHFRSLETSITEVKERLSSLEGRMDSLEKRMDGLEKRMENIEKTMVTKEYLEKCLDERFDNLLETLTSIFGKQQDPLSVKIRRTRLKPSFARA